MKTPRKIKKGLTCCGSNEDCVGCPYDHVVCDSCMDVLMCDALAYIRQLEAGGEVGDKRFSLRRWLANHFRNLADVMWQENSVVEVEVALCEDESVAGGDNHGES